MTNTDKQSVLHERVIRNTYGVGYFSDGRYLGRVALCGNFTSLEDAQGVAARYNALNVDTGTAYCYCAVKFVDGMWSIEDSKCS